MKSFDGNKVIFVMGNWFQRIYVIIALMKFSFKAGGPSIALAGCHQAGRQVADWPTTISLWLRGIKWKHFGAKNGSSSSVALANEQRCKEKGNLMGLFLMMQWLRPRIYLFLQIIPSSTLFLKVWTSVGSITF